MRPFELGQQIFRRIGDQIDQLAVERFRIGEGFPVGDRRFRELNVAAALPGIAAQKRRGVIQNLVLQRLVHIQRKAADLQQRRSRAGVRAGRHGGDVGGQQNEKSRGGPARARGRNVDSHGHRRSQNVLDDVFHGRAQAARRVHGDEDQTGVLAGRFGDSAVDVFGHDRLDFVADAQFDHPRCGTGIG